MKQSKKLPSILRLVSVISLISVLSFEFILQTPVYAAGQITSRSLTLQANGLNGGSKPGAVVNHLFTFTLPTGGNIGSVTFQYCTTAADVGGSTCVAPNAMDATGATLGTTTGITDFSTTLTRTANSVTVTRTTTNNISGGTAVSVPLDNVKNPQGLKADGTTPEPNYTFYVRISTYLSTDGTGTPVDKGTVTASTSAPIFVTGTMPESLIFCTGKTVPVKASTSIPDCANATQGDIQFDQLFDPTTTAAASSQMAASTNAGNGYVITVNGSTLMSGSTNTIPGMAAAAFPQTGQSEFGINLVANDNTYLTNATGADVSPSSVDALNSTLRGEAYTGYSQTNQFKFVPGDIVADSGYTSSGPGTRLASDGQIYTVTYMADVSGSLPAGDYSTTLTYICTPTY